MSTIFSKFVRILATFSISMETAWWWWIDESQIVVSGGRWRFAKHDRDSKIILGSLDCGERTVGSNWQLGGNVLTAAIWDVFLWLAKMQVSHSLWETPFPSSFQNNASKIRNFIPMIFTQKRSLLNCNTILPRILTWLVVVLKENSNIACCLCCSNLFYYFHAQYLYCCKY